MKARKLFLALLKLWRDAFIAMQVEKSFLLCWKQVCFLLLKMVLASDPMCVIGTLVNHQSSSVVTSRFRKDVQWWSEENTPPRCIWMLKLWSGQRLNIIIANWLLILMHTKYQVKAFLLMPLSKPIFERVVLSCKFMLDFTFYFFPERFYF